MVEKRRNKMQKLVVFNHVSLDGFFADKKGDMSWAHQRDTEWNEFVAGNASGGGVLVFGRVTYEMMASYWPTPMAAQNSPTVAEHMNKLQKVVFSRTMGKATWSNTKLLKGDLATEVRRLKKEDGPGLVIMGSGSIVSQLAQEGLIDEYQIVVAPIVVGSGKTLFEGVKEKLKLKRNSSRTFKNGNVFLCYEPAVS
jgi:dihydrofolate reductase